MAVQRYLTAPSLKDCQRALWLKLWISLPLLSLFYICGTVLYSYYRVTPVSVPTLQDAHLVPALVQPSPPTTPIPNDRILPYFVMHVLPSPLRGLLIAALFGATIGTVSAGIHSLATAALIDFGGKRKEGGGESILRVRLLILAFGTVATMLALLVVPRLGTIVQAVVTIIGVFGGPLLGVFMLGALSRRATGNGALIGAVVGAAAGALVMISPRWPGYGISFLWIAFVATVVTYIVGLLASYATRPSQAVEAPMPERAEVAEGWSL
jgi:sodium-coupled monocarboxylate transporter 8/12